MGYVDIRRYRDVLAEAAAVVVPSRPLAYPTGQTVLITAMAMAKCCVISDDGVGYASAQAFFLGQSEYCAGLRDGRSNSRGSYERKCSLAVSNPSKTIDPIREAAETRVADPPI